MAFTYTEFKEALRDYFGMRQTVVSGDGGGDVKDHCGRLSQRYIKAAEFPATVTVTQPAVVTPKVLFIAEEECDVKSIRISAAGSLTISNTDHVRLTVIKRKSPTFSVTESVAVIAIGQTATWTNKTGFSLNPAIATTSGVIDMDPGDTLTGALTKPGSVVALQSAVTVMLAVEEK